MKELLKMENNNQIYSVSLCLSIEADNEDKAIEEFYIRCNECAFDKNSIDIEKEK
jgi:hypothetical protein